MRFGLFGRSGDDEAQAAALATVKGFAKSWLDLYEAHPDTAVTVNEIACLDPACPGNETIILVMEPGLKTRAAKISKTAREVSRQDVREALFPMA